MPRTPPARTTRPARSGGRRDPLQANPPLHQPLPPQRPANHPGPHPEGAVDELDHGERAADISSLRPSSYDGLGAVPASVAGVPASVAGVPEPASGAGEPVPAGVQVRAYWMEGRPAEAVTEFESALTRAPGGARRP